MGLFRRVYPNPAETGPRHPPEDSQGPQPRLPTSEVVNSLLKITAVSARTVAQFVFRILPQIALSWLRHVSTFQNPADGEAAGEEGRGGKQGREWERPGANVQVAARAHIGTGIAQRARTDAHRMGRGSDGRGGFSTV